MNDSLGKVSRKDVKDAKSFARYAHQQIGVPPLTFKQIPAMNARVKEFFTLYPQADWGTLVRVVEFIKARRMRPKNMLEVVGAWKPAWVAGYLTELDPRQNRDENLQQQLAEAISIEEHPRWIERLKGAMWLYSDEQAKAVYQEWIAERQAAGMMVPR